MLIPGIPDPKLGRRLPRRVLREIGSQREVRREIYHRLNGRSRELTVSPEAADLVSGVATALLCMARVLERSGLELPSEFTVRVSQRK